jgi:hypothetical protein
VNLYFLSGIKNKTGMIDGKIVENHHYDWENRTSSFVEPQIIEAAYRDYAAGYTAETIKTYCSQFKESTDLMRIADFKESDSPQDVGRKLYDSLQNFFKVTGKEFELAMRQNFKLGEFARAIIAERAGIENDLDEESEKSLEKPIKPNRERFTFEATDRIEEMQDRVEAKYQIILEEIRLQQENTLRPIFTEEKTEASIVEAKAKEIEEETRRINRMWQKMYFE